MTQEDRDLMNQAAEVIEKQQERLRAQRRILREVMEVPGVPALLAIKCREALVGR